MPNELARRNSLPQEPKVNWMANRLKHRLNAVLNPPASLPMEGRAMLLPYRQTNWPMMGDKELALPGLVAGAYNAFTAPSRAYHGEIPQNQMLPEAMNFAGNVTMDSYALSRAMGNRAIPDADQRSIDVGAQVYHGSPHKFDAFDSTRIGTGEGAQAYGHGLYFSENPDVASGYAQNLARPTVKDSSRIGIAVKSEIDRVFDAHGQHATNMEHLKGHFQKLAEPGAPTEEIGEAFFNMLSDGRIDLQKYLYRVDVPDEAIGRMLDWDKPLSPTVRKQLQPLATRYPVVKSALEHSSTTGGGFYGALNAAIGADATGAAASKAMRDLGIPGIRYLDAGSRNAGEGTRNFVLFDDKLAKIAKRE